MSKKETKVPPTKPVVTGEAKRLKAFRKAEGLSQTEIAERTGFSQSVIARYENGQYVVDIEYIKKLNQVFGLNINWLFTGKGGRNDKPEKKNLISDLSVLQTQLSIHEARIESLEKKLMELARVAFAKKKGVD